jgi:anti-sigma factor RsiW
MKWFLNPCRRRRQILCLLASDVLPERDVAAVQSHLATCAGCRKYFVDIQSVSAPLAGWERHFAHLEPTEAAGLRWSRAILSAAGSKPAHRLAPGILLNTLWRELIWPCRRAWAGMAASWLVVWAINLGLADTQETTASALSPSAPTMFQAFEEQRRILAELLPPAGSQPAEPPRRSPQPRSERRAGILLV